MLSCWRVWLMLCFYILPGIRGLLTRRPDNVVAAVGQSTVEFKCATTEKQPVNWNFQACESSSTTRIVFGGRLVQELGTKFKLDRDAASGVSILTLKNVTVADSGTYTCVDRAGLGPDNATSELTVLSEQPSCATNTTVIDVLVANSCDRSSDLVNVSCGVKYRGNIPPRLSWNNLGENLSNTSWVIPNHSITSTVLIAASSIKDGTSYTCTTFGTESDLDQLNRLSNNYQNHCRTPVIAVKGGITNHHASERLACQLDTITCMLCVRPLCSYRWSDRQSNTTVSLERNLKPSDLRRPPYSYQCEIVCLLSGSSYSYISDVVTCLAKVTRTFETFLLLLSCICTCIATLAIVSIVIWSRYRCAKDIHVSDPSIEAMADGCCAKYHILCITTNTCCTTVKNGCAVTSPLLGNMDGNFMSALYRLEESRVDKMLVELQEKLLMKVCVISAKDTWRKSLRFHQEVVFEDLSSVCKQWHITMTDRKWFKEELSRQLNNMHKPYREHPKFLVRLSTDNYPVRGAIQFRDQIYIVCIGKTAIIVYDAAKPFERKKDIQLAKLQYPRSITACATQNCFYVSDKLAKAIWRVDKNTTVTKFITNLNGGPTMSMMNNGDLLLLDERQLKVYKPCGSISCIIEMPDSIIQPMRAFETKEGNFVISHGWAPGIHGISIITSNGTVCEEYKNQNGNGDNQLDWPVDISMYPQGNIFVLDFHNSKVILFDSNLKRTRVILSRKDDGIEASLRIAYCKDSGNMLVGTLMQNGVDVYRILQKKCIPQ